MQMKRRRWGNLDKARRKLGERNNNLPDAVWHVLKVKQLETLFLHFLHIYMSFYMLPNLIMNITIYN